MLAQDCQGHSATIDASSWPEGTYIAIVRTPRRRHLAETDHKTVRTKNKPRTDYCAAVPGLKKKDNGTGSARLTP